MWAARSIAQQRREKYSMVWRNSGACGQSSWQSVKDAGACPRGAGGLLAFLGMRAQTSAWPKRCSFMEVLGALPGRLTQHAVALAQDAGVSKEGMVWLLISTLLACVLCAWLRPDSALAQSAARALDSSIVLLSQASANDDYVAQPRRVVTTPHPRRSGPHEALPRRIPSLGAEHNATPTAARRRRCTPFQAKRIAAAQDWRCACGCVDPSDPQRRGYLLDASYEIDHIRELAAGGSNDESNLQALLRTHHQAKSSAFARGHPS